MLNDKNQNIEYLILSIHQTRWFVSVMWLFLEWWFGEKKGNCCGGITTSYFCLRDSTEGTWGKSLRWQRLCDRACSFVGDENVFPCTLQVPEKGRLTLPSCEINVKIQLMCQFLYPRRFIFVSLFLRSESSDTPMCCGFHVWLPPMHRNHSPEMNI